MLIWFSATGSQKNITLSVQSSQYISAFAAEIRHWNDSVHADNLAYFHCHTSYVSMFKLIEYDSRKNEAWFPFEHIMKRSTEYK